MRGSGDTGHLLSPSDFFGGGLLSLSIKGQIPDLPSYWVAISRHVLEPGTMPKPGNTEGRGSGVVPRQMMLARSSAWKQGWNRTGKGGGEPLWM